MSEESLLDDYAFAEAKLETVTPLFLSKTKTNQVAF